LCQTRCRDAVIRRTVQFVGHAHGIEHAPENVQFELENFQHALLAFPGGVVLQCDRQTMLDVAARLAQARAEIFVAGRVDPRVMLRPAVQARLVDLRREQFGQRAAAASCQLARRAKVDVGIDGETYAGQHQFLRAQLVRIETDRLAQAQPGFDAAIFTRGAVVVEQALNPLATDFAVRAVGEDRGVLQGMFT
jgi:hypothetical protein